MFGRFALTRALFAIGTAAVITACSGGGTTPVSPSVENAPFGGKLQRQSSAPTAQIKRIPADRDDAFSWTLLEPLQIDSQADFTTPPWAGSTCSPISLFQGVWYYAAASFSVPQLTPVLNPCAISTPTPWGWFRPHALHGAAVGTPPPTPTPNPSASPSATSNLYIVKVDVSFWNINIGAVAGPAQVYPSQWVFAPLVSDEAFVQGHAYAFFVAQYNNPNAAVPIAPQ